jgi:hypothetical protein
LVSLFLHLQRPTDYPTLAEAITYVRLMRELQPVEWPSAPKPILIEAAERAVRAVHQLQGHVYLQGADP